MSDIYRTIATPAEGIYKEKGSRFISFLFPVTSEEEIREILRRIKKEHHTARHHCYAWRLGAGEIRYRANDDGEPSSTAGKPILGQLISHDLTQVLLVVVRYFGGTSWERAVRSMPTGKQPPMPSGMPLPWNSW